MTRTLRLAFPAAAVLAFGGAGVLYNQGNGTGFLLAFVAGLWLLAGGALAWHRWLGLAFVALEALCVSLYLGAKHRPTGEASLCSQSSIFDCDAVNTSAYSEVLGVPIAYLGAAFYGAMVAVALLAHLRPQRYARAPHLVAVGGAIAVAYSVFLAGASYSLGAWCLFCVSLYGLNAMVLGAGLVGLKDSDVELGAGITQAVTGKDDGSLTAALGAGVLVLIATMGWYNATAPEGPAVSTTEAIEQVASAATGPRSTQLDLTPYFEGTDGPLVLDGTEPILGDPAAPYTVVEFADFQCPSCAAVAPGLHELVQRESRVRALFKHYPISDICNPNVDGARHADSCAAAAAHECARQQGRSWELLNLMFKNQTRLQADGLAFMAGQVGLDLDAFGACMAAPSTMEAVKADIAAATQVGVHATPSLYLKGLRGEEWVHVRGGPAEIELLVKAHASGMAIPPTPEASHDH